VTIRNGQGWTNTLVNCRDVEYNFVKVIGFGPSSDGINPAGSQRVRITNCFMRNTDDCVAIKAPDYEHPVKDVLVANNIMIGFAYADGITIGFETNAKEVSNVTVRDCDILMARGGSRVDGHSGFSIICDGPAVIHDILFENIRVERADVKLFELNITDGKQYGDDPPGHIRGVTIRNVEWLHEGRVVLHGYNAEHLVQDVVFENCKVAGKPLKNLKDKNFHVNEFVKDVEVKSR
jgi:polygalacturonase